MKPLPTLSQCYAILLQEENQRDVHHSFSNETENLAMPVKSSFTSKASNKGVSTRKITDGSMVCDFCHMSGHLKEKCYCIHGYPSWHKLFGKPKPKPKFLQNKNSIVAQVSQTTSAPAQQSTKSDATYTANTVQVVGHFVSQVYSVGNNLSKCKWIIDTGATDHITPCLTLLQDVRVCNTFLQLPNGEKSVVTHMGNFKLNSQMDHSWPKPLELGKEENGLYMLTTDACHADVNSTSVVSVAVPSNFSAQISHIDMWHARLGHPSLQVMKMVPVSLSSKVLDVCDICQFAKHSRTSFPDSNHVSENLFDLVHGDLWGPYRIPTHGTYKWFLTLVEDKSRSTWAYLLPDKTSVFAILKEFVALVKNQFETTIKTFQTDNGTEFFNTSVNNFLQNLGIIHQASCAYTPQQNGLVERKHRHLLDCARTLRFHANLPITFWGDCVLTAAYLINRTPTKVLQGKSPFQVFFNTLPDYTTLKVFGSLCYATIVPHPADKFATRSIKGVFLGYPFAKKGYKILNLETKRVFISRDVKFIETVFPFRNISVQTPHSMFPAHTMYIDDDPLSASVLNQSDVYSEIVTSEDSQLEFDSNDTPISSSESTISQASSGDASDPPCPVNRPVRHRKLPTKFEDFVDIPRHLVSTVSNEQSLQIVEPQFYKQAVQIPEWCEAMNVELAALEANHTWEVVPLPATKKVVGCKWLYKVKYLANDKIDKFKARLVAKGFTQITNIDYFETFAPVAKMTSFTVLLDLAAMYSWKITQLDVTNAFFHGILDEEVYMTCPDGYTIPTHILQQFPNQKLVCKLLKSLYGLKQAPRQWFIALSATLLSFGFIQTSGDPSLFVYKQGNSLLYLLIYVDDMLMTGNDSVLMSQVNEFLNSHFKIKDLGDLHFFLDIQVTRTSAGIFMNQSKYVLDILTSFSELKSKTSLVPIEQHHELLHESDSPLLSDVTAYRRLVGKLIYLTISRPDLSYGVHVLAQFMHKPQSIHWHAALKLVRYLNHTTSQGLFYKFHTNPVLKAFCDVDWGGCQVTRQSLTGYCLTLGDTLVSWKCKKQHVVSRSSAEAEYRSMADVTCEITWLVSLLIELHVSNITPVPLFCDNQSALYIASNPVFHERTKHIEIDCHLVRQKLKHGLISPQHVSTLNQPADLFTKAVSSAQLSFLLSKLGVSTGVSPPNLRGDGQDYFGSWGSSEVHDLNEVVIAQSNGAYCQGCLNGKVRSNPY
ncbi:hypothetical protein AgCh_022503 [Apium graveolens]